MKFTAILTLAVTMLSPLATACKCKRNGVNDIGHTRHCCKVEEIDHGFWQFEDDCARGGVENAPNGLWRFAKCCENVGHRSDC